MPSSGNCSGVQIKKLGDSLITSIAGLERFEPGVESALPLIQKALDDHVAADVDSVVLSALQRRL